MPASWIRSLFPSRSRPYRHAATPKAPSRVRLGVEPLEGRALPSFLTPFSVPAGASEGAAAVGDFNGDGKPDLAVSNFNGLASAVSVALGNGDGTFLPAVASPNSAGSWSMVAGDFNRDGKLDLAAASVGANAINLLLGNGDGTFQAPVAYAVGATVNRIAKGDFNGDGADDLVGVSTGYGGTLFVLKNAGNGTFLPAQGYSAGLGAQDVSVADLNRDGKLDLVTANQSSAGGVATLLGNGDGTFQSSRSFPASTAPYRAAVGDYNEDGVPDVAVLNTYISNQFSLILGTGDGGFQAPHSYPMPNGGSTQLQAADFNGDGHLDLIEANGQVELGRGDGSFYAIQANAGFSGSTLTLGDFNGDGAADAVATGFGTAATVMANAANDRALLGGATQLGLSAPATAVAGQPFAVTVTALDAAGNVAANFLGTVGFANPLNPAVAASYTFTAADAGVHTVANAGTLLSAGVQTLFATSPLLPTASTAVTVSAAAAARFRVSAPATAAAGDPTTSVTVAALDAFGNAAPSYVGAAHFASTDAQAGLPANYAFTAADAGTHAFAVTLRTAGPQTVTATDTLNPNASGTTAGVAVTPGTAVALSLSGGGGFVNSPQVVAVTARDAFGNVATSYAGTAHLTTSDPLATVPADGPVTNGVGLFTVTPRTIGTQTVTATDGTGLAGTESVVVTPGQGVRFTVTPVASAAAGTVQSMKVTVYDAFGNVSTVYAGTMRVFSSDPTVSGYHTFTAADAGAFTFTLALTRAGTQSVTVADVLNPAMSITQTGVVVTPGVAVSLGVTPLTATTAGVAQSVTVTARDAYGNAATGYRGALAFSSSDLQVAMLSAYTFTAADAGSHVFSVTFKSSRGQTFTATDTATPALTYFQKDIQVSAASMAGFALKVPSNATAGVAFALTVSAVDAFGNPVTGYVGKVHFTGPTGVPADYTFTAADAGVHTFTVTLLTTGTLTIGAQDTSNGALKGQTSVKVVSSGGGTSGGTGGGGRL